MMESLVTLIIGALLGISALLVLLRVVRGPSVVDRPVATEVLLSTIVCALGVEAATTRHSTTLPIVITLSLLGFTGSVAVARFLATERDPVDQADGAGSPGHPPGTDPATRGRP